MNNLKSAKKEVIKFINYTFDNLGVSNNETLKVQNHMIDIVDNDKINPVTFMENFYNILENLWLNYIFENIGSNNK
jgi:hypothetical protein